MKKIEPVEIGREEAFELSGYELPTKNKERLIIRQVGHPSGNSIIYKKGSKYFIACLVI